jgi:hypothetical protein
MNIDQRQGGREDSNVESQTGEADSPVAIRVSAATKARLDALLSKVNDKEHGRRVKADTLMAFALDLVSDAHLQSLRDASLSNMDRLEILFQQHRKKRKALTKDQFVGLLISGKLES